MGKLYEELTPNLVEFISEQKLFFVGTAPLGQEGHINISPKGMDCLKVLDSKTIAYLDVTGSGVETISQIKENGRLVFMFCAFEGKANILRLYGRGEVFDFAHPEFPDYLKLFPDYGKVRAVIKINLTRIQDSCGWGVPFYEFKGERDQLKRSENHRTYDEWVEHRYNTNSHSIDGLPGLTRPAT